MVKCLNVGKEFINYNQSHFQGRRRFCLGAGRVIFLRVNEEYRSLTVLISLPNGLVICDISQVWGVGVEIY